MPCLVPCVMRALRLWSFVFVCSVLRVIATNGSMRHCIGLNDFCMQFVFDQDIRVRVVLWGLRIQCVYNGCT